MSKQALSISLEITSLILLCVAAIVFCFDTRNVAANALEKANGVEEIKKDISAIKGDVKVLLERTK